MRIAKVIGSVTLSRCHPTFRSANLRLVVPQSLAKLVGGADDLADTLVAWDELNVGSGSLVGVSEGGEATQPFRPEEKPVDVYIAAILDDLDIDADVLQ